MVSLPRGGPVCVSRLLRPPVEPSSERGLPAGYCRRPLGPSESLGMPVTSGGGWVYTHPVTES